MLLHMSSNPTCSSSKPYGEVFSLVKATLVALQNKYIPFTPSLQEPMQNFCCGGSMCSRKDSSSSNSESSAVPSLSPHPFDGLRLLGCYRRLPLPPWFPLKVVSNRKALCDHCQWWTNFFIPNLKADKTSVPDLEGSENLNLIAQIAGLPQEKEQFTSLNSRLATPMDSEGTVEMVATENRPTIKLESGVDQM
jgi:hypothetical protein